MLTYIIIILCTFLIGFGSYYIGMSISRMMEYGGIFWKVRHNRFLKYANGFHIKMAHDILSEDILNKDLISLRENESYPYATKRDTLNKLQWEVVTYKPEFKLWMCTECMSYRIALTYEFIFLLSCILLGYISWLGCLIFCFWAVPILQTSISIQAKINE